MISHLPISNFVCRIVLQTNPDGASNIQFVDTSLVFLGPGRLVAWDIYTGRAGTQRLQVWRPAGYLGTRFTLICENVLSASKASDNVHYQLDSSDHCNVQKGDVVGWYH